MMEKIKAYSLFEWCGALFLFFVPWGTRWIYGHSEVFPLTEWGRLSWYVSEVLAWIFIFSFFVPAVVRWGKNGFPVTHQEKRARAAAGVALVFFVFNLARTFFLPDVSVALQWTTRALAGFLIFVIFSLVEQKTMRLWLWFFVLGGAFSGGLGVAQFLTQHSFASTLLGIAFHDASQGGVSVVEAGGRWLRAYGTFSHPNVLGAYMVFVLVACGALVSTEEKRIKRIFIVACGIVCAAAFFFSFSRAAWMAGALIGVALGIYFVHTMYVAKKNRDAVVVYKQAVVGALASWCVTVLCLAFIFAPLVFVRTAGEGRLEQKSTNERKELVNVAKNLIAQHPFFGVGQGHFVHAYQQAQPSKDMWSYQSVHNVLLFVAVEQGGVGVLLIIAFFVWWVLGLETVRKRKWFFCGIVTLIIFFFFDHFWLTLPQGMWLFALVPSVFTSYPLFASKNH